MVLAACVKKRERIGEKWERLRALDVAHDLFGEPVFDRKTRDLRRPPDQARHPVVRDRKERERLDQRRERAPFEQALQHVGAPRRDGHHWQNALRVEHRGKQPQERGPLGGLGNREDFLELVDRQ